MSRRESTCALSLRYMRYSQGVVPEALRYPRRETE